MSNTTRTVGRATSTQLSTEQFLLLGAVVGLVGWTGTAVVELLAVPRAGLLTLGLWVVLVAVMSGAGLVATPNAVRFSLPLLGWGVLNTIALLATVVAVTVGASPDTVWAIWAGDLALGHAWTARTLQRAHKSERAVTYGTAALLGVGLLLLHSFDAGTLQPVRYLALGAVHALPLALDTRRRVPTATRTAAMLGGVLGITAVGLLL
jgi:hypothetical protein